MENLIYLGKVNLCWILFYACFWLFFRKYTFFELNRLYLLGTLLSALFLPLITISEAGAERIPDFVYSISVTPDFSYNTEIVHQEIINQNTGLAAIILMIYLAGVIFMSFNMLIGFVNLLFIISRGCRINYENQTLILLPEKTDQRGRIGSFSFFKWLVISHEDYENCLENIVRHEMVHIRQKHSVDILIVEFLKIIFWFNPVLWLYKISIQELHEYLADVNAPDPDDYAVFLISYSFNASVLPLSNPIFNSSLLKTRIKMIFQNRTSRWLLGKYTMVLPLLGFIILLTAERDRFSEVPESGVKVIANDKSKINEKTYRRRVNDNRPFKLKEKDYVLEKPILDRNAFFGKGFRWTEDYFYSQINYPIEAVIAEIQGRVIVSFIVDENGYIKDTEIVDGLGYGIDEEALRVVQNMPKWNNAIKNGKPAAVKITMGIDFYPALAMGSRKSDIELKKEYYNVAPKIATQTNHFNTISEIGKFVKKSLDFSGMKAPETTVSRYGYSSGFSFYPPIKVLEDSAAIEKR